MDAAMTDLGADKTKPCAGIRVIEIARILAGPWAGQALADLGADVVKVEAPQGDDTRQWGPPFITRDDGAQEAAYYHACNRGKRSIIIDFKTAEGRQVLCELIKDADVLIENFKLGGLKKYDLDYASVKALNPKLIYCSITGFGQTGPYSQRAGYDFMIQGMSGIMDLTGEALGEPQKVGVAYADIFTGLYSVIGIQAALLEREKTGEGCHLDMALLDCQVGVLANQAMNYLASGQPPSRLGNAHPNIVPYQVFAVSDGHVIIAVGNDGQFRRLCKVLGDEPLGLRAEFASNEMRVKNRADLIERLTPLIKSFKRDELMDLLTQATVPVGPINRVDQMFADEQVQFRQMQVDLLGRAPKDAQNESAGESIPSVRIPIVKDEVALGSAYAAPKLGEHTREILEEIGWKNSGAKR